MGLCASCQLFLTKHRLWSIIVNTLVSEHERTSPAEPIGDSSIRLKKEPVAFSERRCGSPMQFQEGLEELPFCAGPLPHSALPSVHVCQGTRVRCARDGRCEHTITIRTSASGTSHCTDVGDSTLPTGATRLTNFTRTLTVFRFASDRRWTATHCGRDGCAGCAHHP